MKVEVNEHGTIILKEVFNPVKLITSDDETLIVTMRDSGYEVCYENEFYELKQGIVKNMKKYDVWKPTPQLRWKTCATQSPYATRVKRPHEKTLQQLWVDDDGNEEWRNVPTVN